MPGEIGAGLQVAIYNPDVMTTGPIAAAWPLRCATRLPHPPTRRASHPAGAQDAWPGPADRGPAVTVSRARLGSAVSRRKLAARPKVPPMRRSASCTWYA
jgi:hypothetical protein